MARTLSEFGMPELRLGEPPDTPCKPGPPRGVPPGRIVEPPPPPGVPPDGAVGSMVSPSRRLDRELSTRLITIEGKLDAMFDELVSQRAAREKGIDSAFPTTATPSPWSQQRGEDTEDWPRELPGTANTEEDCGPPAMSKVRTSVSTALPMGRRVSATTSDRRSLAWNQSSSRTKTWPRVATTFHLDHVYNKWVEVRRRAIRAPPVRSLEFVQGCYFQAVTSGVILLNSIFIGFSASASVSESAFGRSRPEWYAQVDFAFFAYFALELWLRILSERLAFLLGTGWRWNMFDTFLVAFSLVDYCLNGLQQTGGGALPIGRVFRFARFVRLLRLTRVIKNLHSLRVVVLAIIESLSSMVWSFAVVAFVMYVFAVYILYEVSDYFYAVGPEANDNDSIAIKAYYGDVYKAMVTLFMAISGGVDWVDRMSPLLQISDIFGPFFMVYIFFMYFGVLNVVIGAFVASTSEIASRDREVCIQQEMQNLQAYRKRIKQFFEDADKDHSGTLTWDEFAAHLDNTQVKAYFQALELDVGQAHMLFDLLDRDHNDQVTIDEFLDGCMRMKGTARALDVNILLVNQQRLSAYMERVFPLPPSGLVSPAKADKFAELS